MHGQEFYSVELSTLMRIFFGMTKRNNAFTISKHNNKAKNAEEINTSKQKTMICFTISNGFKILQFELHRSAMSMLIG
jgi:hypothetical protein